MFRMAYTQGVQAALSKYAGMGDFANSMLASPNLRRNLNIAGLGLIAAPTVHSMVTGDEPESKTMKTVKHISDLAGLGLLTGTEFMKH